MDMDGASSPTAAATTKINAGLRTGQSGLTDAAEAVAEFYHAVVQPDLGLVMFFCSVQYELDVLEAEMNRRFPGVPVVGCTTAGEIGPVGCRTGGISGVSFSSETMFAVTGHLPRLQQFDFSQAQSLTQDMLQRLERRRPHAEDGNSFAILLIDGLSMREEPVARAFQDLLGVIPLVGASAADEQHLEQTFVYVDGRFHADSAVVVLATTALPVRTFKIQHFVPTDERVVVTAADTEHRIVSEIDGRPAAEAYAELIGVDVQNLDPTLFATEPMVVMIDGTNFVRSIGSANPDGSLRFFSSIEEGLVLRAARGVDLVENLELSLADLRSKIGDLQLVIGFDCILRRLEYSRTGLLDRVERVFLDNHVVGFNCYGEQFSGVHINQTLTGLAVGTGRDD